MASRLSIGNAGACLCQQLQVNTVPGLPLTKLQKGRGSGLDPFPEKGLLGAYANVPPLSRAPSLQAGGGGSCEMPEGPGSPPPEQEPH